MPFLSFSARRAWKKVAGGKPDRPKASGATPGTRQPNEPFAPWKGAEKRPHARAFCAPLQGA
jgi:hypothetical protein